ncbi:hypothetical protein V6N11_021537 [Hibiscus sabdariffa]|uniref:Uncharacterized protein n=1 Tax=Hibiscus sabdariffa TaxID=183260 RepID=A0ABR2NHQ0_9ROSI
MVMEAEWEKFGSTSSVSPRLDPNRSTESHIRAPNIDVQAVNDEIFSLLSCSFFRPEPRRSYAAVCPRFHLYSIGFSRFLYSIQSQCLVDGAVPTIAKRMIHYSMNPRSRSLELHSDH